MYQVTSKNKSTELYETVDNVFMIRATQDKTERNRGLLLEIYFLGEGAGGLKVKQKIVNYVNKSVSYVMRDMGDNTFWEIIYHPVIEAFKIVKFPPTGHNSEEFYTTQFTLSDRRHRDTKAYPC